ncbi:MAG: very short patch repair endonuclease [Verrucomicrobiota bacterium]
MSASKDRLSPEQRSWNMSRIRGKDTKPEVAVRQHLHRMGFRFRLHVRIPIGPTRNSERGTRKEPLKIKNSKLKIPSHHSALRVPRSAFRFVRPDIVLPRYKTAIFVHGCFWHRHKGCKNCTTPTHRQEFWLAKLNGNAARDKLHQRALKKLGWRVIVIWECEVADPVRLDKFILRPTHGRE